MDPSSSSITAAVTVEARGVRFDDECVLIPSPQPRSRMPKLLAKPSSFIFKRKDVASPTSPHDHDASRSPAFPRPALSRKFSLNEGKPPPAPIQRRSSLPPPSRARHARRASLPPSHLVTVPLRPCCPNCFSATESAALQGDNWTESFSRAARRRRSASVDNHPCPPHLLADSGATIQWSTVAESTSTTPFLSVLVVDEANRNVTPGATDDDVASAGVSDEQGSNAILNGLDHLSVQDSDDDILPPMLSRHKPWLSPVPSNNPSADDLSPASAAAEDADGLRMCSSPASTSISPPASPLPQTPSSSTFPTPVSSPTISSPTRQREREASPRIPNSFRIPKGASLVRAGSDILKGVRVLGGGPI
ncbi:hypothetical protein BC826DRAFT_1185638 [Russula brevipes]|nr:hypothetical protein BC826DRAFT_1185638 [Russula brevipes]